MDFSPIFNALQSNATEALLALSLLALAWVYRDQRKRDSEHAAQVTTLYEAHAKAMQEANAAHLQTALQVAPLASKLVTCVEILERMSARVGS